MNNEWIKVAAPATTSNIGPGFDTFGLALKEPYDVIEGRKIESGIVISDIQGPGSDSIPSDPKRNSVCIAAEEVLRRSGADFGIEFRIKKGIRPGSGLGSSGASHKQTGNGKGQTSGHHCTGRHTGGSDVNFLQVITLEQAHQGQ